MAPWFRSKSDEIVPVELPPEVAEEVDRLIADDRYFEAIRYVRKRTGLDLVGGKRAVDHRMDAR